MEKMGSCFVCYAHEEIDRSSLDYFIETINQRIKNRVKLYFDEDLKYGEDFNGFTQHISEVDSIIVIMTPAFKRKVALRVGGVNDEFNQILERLDQSENNEGNFSFIPILFSGDNSNSIPPEFKNFKYLDLTYLRVNKKSSGEFVIPRTIRTRYFEELKKIISEIIVSTTLSSDNYQELSKTYFDDLFVDLKASYNRQVQGIHYLDLIVKTNCYQKIISQESYIAIGRKGSGKTTLSQTIPLLHPERYLFIVEIVADAFNLETLYATYSKDQFRADIRDIASRQRVFQFTWEATLIITIMTLLIENRELPYSIKNHPYMSSFESFISSLRNDTHIDVAGYYEYCFNNINGFLNACIQQAGANPEMFFTDIKSRFNVDSFLEYVFGKEVLSKFYSLMALINQYCFISLDGFDNAFDEFRKNSILYKESTENVRSRNQFEIDWLQGLFAFVIKAKTNVDNHFYKRLEFCIVAPYDRFLEVVHSERDSYRTWSRWLSMQWSGIELAILLRKRLEGLIQNYRTSKDSSPIERLGLVLNHVQFQYIPKELEFEFNGRQYTSDLFLYVLRLTLWRPRDILTFYAKIGNSGEIAHTFRTYSHSEARKITG